MELQDMKKRLLKLMAGINAHLKVHEKAPLILKEMKHILEF
jgi:hypothetical protein